MRPSRAHSIFVGKVMDQPVYLAALNVGDETAQPIGFLASHGEREERTTIFGQPNPDWRAPTKFKRAR
jgi:hypothetical protein